MSTDTFLIRWGNRRANSYQALAEDGYAVLAERLRSDDERAVVRGVLERVLRVTLDLDAVYSADATAAQQQLSAALQSCPDHEFAVGSPCAALGSALSYLSVQSGVVASAKTMLPKGLNLTLWRYPENKKHSRNHRV